MILDSLTISKPEFERRTGWEIKPEGLCKGEICVLLPEGARDDVLDVEMLAERLNMPLIQDERQQFWCLGPEAGGRALATAKAPEIELPDLNGNPFQLNSLLGSKVLLIAWASW